MAKQKPAKASKQQIADYLRMVAMDHGINPEEFVRVAVQETQLKPNATNPSGAAGLFQIMPDNAQSAGIDPYSIKQSANHIAKIMANAGREGYDYYLEHNQGKGGARGIKEMAEGQSLSRYTAENKNLPWVKRALRGNNQEILNDDGSVTTHELAAEVDEDGTWHVFPTAQMVDGALRRLPLREAQARAMKSGTTMQFGKDKDAAIEYSKNGLIDHSAGGAVRRPVSPELGRKLQYNMANQPVMFPELNIPQSVMAPIRQMPQGKPRRLALQQARADQARQQFTPQQLSNTFMNRQEGRYNNQVVPEPFIGPYMLGKTPEDIIK